MNLLTNTTTIALWHDVIAQAQDRCAVSLDKELEAYLIQLLDRYTNKPELLKQIIATAFLDALKLKRQQRDVSLQHVGDQCLLFTGLFPHMIEKRHVKIRYFVDLGRSAYASIFTGSNLIFNNLAMEFVLLMDILQSVRQCSELLPLQAYEQWHELGSQRAYKILQSYTKATPLYTPKR